MSPIKTENILLNIFLLLIIVAMIFSQDKPTPTPPPGPAHEILKLNKTSKGVITTENTLKYFKLQIPASLGKGKTLNFKTQTNLDSISKLAEEGFSDIDIFISKTNLYPENTRSSDWYSESYGPDIISVPPSSVKPGDIFYIGLYCETKCKYELSAQLADETEIILGEEYEISIKQEETMNYKLSINKDFKNLRVISYAKSGGTFKIYMNKNDMPTSDNSFEVSPSWKNGYSIEVSQEDKDEYCTNCTYHILIQNDGKQTINSLMLYTYLTEEVFELTKNQQYFDFISNFERRCYKFPMTAEDKKHEKLIIQINLFSGDAGLLIEGWKLQNIEDLRRSGPPRFDFDNFHQISSSEEIILSKIDFDKYDKDLNENITERENFDLYFCLNSFHETSYSLTTYFLTQIDKIQELEGINYLTPGQEIRGYLPKDSVARYELVGADTEKAKFGITTNLTIETISVVGKVSSYAYPCLEQKCAYKKGDLQDLLQTKKLIQATKGTNDNEEIITIKYNENTCMKTPSVKLANGNEIMCSNFIYIKCDKVSENDDLCIYDVSFNTEFTPLLMKPNDIYEGTIPVNAEDIYEIMITDEKIHSIVVVMNTQSGDAELLFFKINEGKDKKVEETLIKGSFNDNYLPEVIRITPAIIKKDDLVGKYRLKVVANGYASYHLYYYVTYNKEETDLLTKYRLPEITLRLSVGDYIVDYFPADINYKVFAFSTSLRAKSNLKVFINKVNIAFEFYIYGKITDIPVGKLQNYTKETVIDKYLWKSNDQNSELIIGKNDPKYELDKTYYIVVIPKILFLPDKNSKNINGPMIGYDKEIPSERKDRKDLLPEKSAMKFYLGVAEKHSALIVNEGNPHQFWLNSDYEGQLYFYNHLNVNKDFEIRVDVSYGVVSVFFSFDEIDTEKIDKLLSEGKKDEVQKLIYDGDQSIGAIGVFTIKKEEFKKKTNKNSYSTLYIYIRRSEEYKNTNKNCFFTFVVKSSEDKGELLLPGEVRNSEFKENKIEHFIIEEVQRRNGGVINVNFRNGYGKVYVRIPTTPEIRNIRWPGPDHYDYIGEQVYSGVMVKIPKDVYDTLDNRNIKLQILVTVEAILASNDDREYNSIIGDASFSITYSNEPKIINQNNPYDGFLHNGEMDYFTFYFEEDTENIFIGLSGMSGDADMYLNYGTSMPTPSRNNWESIESGIHEYIDFNLEDDFFKKNKITSLKGFYTLLVIGLSDTSFTIYISKHKNKIIPLRNNRPMPCYCENKGDKCFFRLNEVFEVDNKKKGVKRNELIFTTQYLYGNGYMYAKLISDDSELYSKDFYKSFPDENDYDMSNDESHQRNYIKMKLAPEKITPDSIVLMTFECEEKTQVDITVTNLRHYKSIDFMAFNRENVYYLGYNPDDKEEQAELDIVFANYYTDKDFIYTIHSYTGDAHVRVYSNDSNWDQKTQKVVYDYKLFKEFEIISNPKSQSEQIDIYNPYSSDYHNFISKREKERRKTIFFKITPKSEFGFYIQGSFDKEWNNIIIGKPKTYFAKNGELNGYFDIIDEYDDIEFNLNVQNNLLMSAEVFIKINVVDTTKRKVFKESDQVNEFQLFKYSLPSSTNYNYKMRTDPTLGTLSIYIDRLPKLTKEEENYKFIRALFLVKIRQEAFTPLPSYDPDEYTDNDIKKVPDKRSKKNQEFVSILVTPGVSHYKYIDAKPYEYYFSNVTYNPQKKKSMKRETKIFTLQKLDPSDNMMVIEISTCNGNYEYKITENYLPSDIEQEIQNGLTNFDYHEENRNGKKIIYVKNLVQKHIYLSIKSKPTDLFCSMHKLTTGECDHASDLSYLMYYYSTSNKHLFITDIFDKLLFPRPYGKGKIRIPLPKLIVRDINKNVKEINDYRFDIFASTDETYFKKMESVCYLSKFQFWKEGKATNGNETEIFNLENIHVSQVDKSQNLIISGLRYRAKYYIAILAQNIKTKEMIAFRPFIAWSGGYLPFALWQMLATNILVILLIIILIIICRKYRGAKKELKEIKGDALPKTSDDVTSSSGGQGSGVKYSGLGESY